MNNQLKIKPLIYTAILLFFVPNVIFCLASWIAGDERAIINVDYLLPFLLLATNKKILKVLGGLLFVVIFTIDILLIVLQHYPSFHFKDSLYLLGFILAGPKIFLGAAIVVLCILIAELILLWKLSSKITIKNVLVVMFLFLLVNSVVYIADKGKGLDVTVYNTSFANSSTVYFIQNQEKNFSNLLGGNNLVPSPYYNATTPWIKKIQQHTPLNKKLFLIVLESWGEPLNKAIQEDILQNLKEKSDSFDYFDQGSFKFYGFTVEGELRELCQLYPTTLDLYQIKTGFQNCMPHQLNELGYETVGIHGGGAVIYGRKEWYPKAGFKTRTFQEDLNKPVNCIPFDGICDWDVLPYIKSVFAKDQKVFNYWLTLTSHFEYYTHDIHNKRFDCSVYNIPNDGNACHNFMLQAQFFDYIADLVSAPEMKGVEVIIVGDHPPPLFKASENALFKDKNDKTKEGSVAWVHFKIKD